MPRVCPPLPFNTALLVVVPRVLAAVVQVLREAGGEACDAYVYVQVRDRLAGRATATDAALALWSLAADGWVTRLPGSRHALAPGADPAHVGDAAELRFAADRARHVLASCP